VIQQIWAVLAKELTDSLRDRRSILSAMMFPLLGVGMFAAMMIAMSAWTDSGRSAHLAVEGRVRAPNLVAFLQRQGVQVEDAPKDYEAQVKEGTFDAALVIPEDYPKLLAQGRLARLDLLSDQSRQKSAQPVAHVQRWLSLYAQQLGTQRLVVRGVSPELAQAIEVRQVNLASPEKMATLMLGMVPVFLLLSAFMGGMHVAIDTTAGERERGSLEPLLLNPVERVGLVVGKWLATSVAGMFAVSLALGGFMFAMRFVPLADLGIKAHLGPVEALWIVAILAPMALFGSCAQMLVATFARSFKEAQSYLSILMLVPMAPGMALMFLPVDGSVKLEAIPLLGQCLLINGALRGDAGLWAGVLAAGAVCAVLTWVCLRATTSLLGNEKIIFGRAS
jgi:sodium transport system permease protein